MPLAPIAFFAYNRPEQTAASLNALAQNILAKQSSLYVFCDGPKPLATPKEIALIDQVRSIVKNIDGFKDVIVTNKSNNSGLANSIIAGVTEIVEKHGNVIVLEDDILTSKHFLEFMNTSLNLYEHVDKVFSVGACNYFAIGKKFPSFFFIPIPDCWGWATWKNRWRFFEPNSKILLDKLQNEELEEAFDLFGGYPFKQMLLDQLKGNNNSWAIRWQAVCYLQNKLAIYPNPSVSQHMHSLDATHASAMYVAPPLANKTITVKKETPALLKYIYKAMLKGYTYGLLQNKLHYFLAALNFYKSWFAKNEAIKTYLLKHNGPQ